MEGGRGNFSSKIISNVGLKVKTYLYKHVKWHFYALKTRFRAIFFMIFFALISFVAKMEHFRAFLLDITASVHFNSTRN